MMPVVILDGTGDVNPAYTDGRYRFDMIDDFHRPHVPMHIIQYGEISGSYDLTKDGRNKARRLFDNMPQVLGDNYEMCIRDRLHADRNVLPPRSVLLLRLQE